MGISVLAILAVVTLAAICAGSLLGIISAFQLASLRQEIRMLRLEADAARGTLPIEAPDAAGAPQAQAFPDAASAEPDPSESIPGEPAAGDPTLGETDFGEPDGQPRAATGAMPPPLPPEATGPALPSGETPSPPPPASPAGARLEDRIGGNLTVWIGGLALAIGGLFLVRYTVEAGLLGPRARTVLGGLFATALLALGEAARRLALREGTLGDATSVPEDEGGRSVEARVSEAVADRAYIPGVLTAAGIIAAFATVYAAYALYGFIGDALAFVGLGAAGFLGLALSVRQGPWIAAVGLAAGYVTPALVSSSSPSAAALFIYLLVLTAAVYLTAWLRGWRELAYLAAIGSTGWGLLWLVDVYRAADAPVLIGYCILLPALAIALLRRGTEQPVGDEATSDEQADPAPSKLSTRIIKAIRAGADPIVTPIVAANAFLTLAFVTVSGHGVLAIIGTAGVAALLVAAALALPGLRSLAAIAGTLFISHLASWPRPLGFVAADPLNPSSSSTGEMLWVRRVEDPEAMIWFALIGAVVLGGVALWNVFTRTAWPVWAALASAVPVLAYVLTYLATGAGQTSIPFALTALFSAALFATATDRLDRRRLDVAAPDRRTAQAVGALAAAACAFLALAMAVSLNQGWLTIGLAMMAPALAWIDRKRDLPILRAIVAVLAAIVVARLIWRPDIVGDDLGTTPIFNWALYGYGVPTVAFALAAWWLERTRDDVSAKLARGAAIAFLAALIGVQVRHLINGGDVLANRYGLQEAALHTLSWLGLSLGLRWGAFRRDDGLMLQAANLFGLLSLAHIATVHLVRLLPFVTEAPIEGGVILNTLLLAYFLPSVLAGLTVMQFQKRQQALPDGGVPGLPWSPRSVADLYVLVTAVFTVLLIFAYLTLQVSRVFQGPILDAAPSDGELYAWSLVWVVFAVCLLGGGIGWQVSALRQAGFAFLTLATCKIFLFDMAALTGLLRALSFIGLGAALMGIGFAYQRLMGRASATT